MFAIFEREKGIAAAMAVCFGIGLVLRILQGMLYLAIIRETEEMATTKNRLLMQCKQKFAHCYRLNDGVANIPVFVEKFLNRLAVGPLSFQTMYHLSGQAVLLSVVWAGIGIVKSIMSGRTLGEILPFYIVSFLGLYVYFSISSLVNLKGKRQALKVNLIDYLENHLAPRMETENGDPELTGGAEQTADGFRKHGQAVRSQKGKNRLKQGGPSGAEDSARAEELRESICLPRRRDTREEGKGGLERFASGPDAGSSAGAGSSQNDNARTNAPGEMTPSPVLADAMSRLTEQELDELLQEFSV